MPFHKYREWAQWGKTHTRILKEVYNAKKKQKVGNFPTKIPHGKTLYTAEEIMNELEVKLTPQEIPKFEHPAFTPPKPEDHPLFKSKFCHLFDGSSPFSDGVDQACALLAMTKAQPIPKKVYDTANLVYRLRDVPSTPKITPPYDLNTLEGQVADAIMQGERYDPTFERLERRFDPVIFWIKYRPVHGCPVIKRNNIILDALYRRVMLLAIEHNNKGDGPRFQVFDDIRVDREWPFSSCFTHEKNTVRPFVIRHESPRLVAQSPHPNNPWANMEAVENTRKEPIPDTYPIDPFVDIKSDYIYNVDPVIPRLNIPGLQANFMLIARQQSQKYPWTMEQNLANAVMYAFGLAVNNIARFDMHNWDDTKDTGSQSRKISRIKKLKKPVVAKVVQLCNGRLDLVAVQLNTLDIYSKQLEDRNAVKNMVFIEKGLPLYRPKPYYENMDYVQDLNMDTFRKFAAFLLHR